MINCARVGRPIVLTLCLAAAGVHADVGKVLYLRGNASAQAPGQSLRIVAAGAPLTAGDTVSTGNESFSVLELKDTTRILLRPDTSFTVAAYDDTEGQENVALSLIKGGIRALTGLLGKRRPNAFRLDAGVATIGIRGTNFALRRCGAECADEAKTFPKLSTPVASVVGRALAAVGDVSIATPNQPARHVVKGTPVYVGDVVTAAAASFAVLAFQDQTRVTLQPGAQFLVEDYRFAPEKPATETALFRLLRGGLRFATGLMAQRRPDSLRVGTAVATIGIRGTGFDLTEATSCGGKEAAADSPGLTAHVWKGAIALQESNATVQEGETVCVLEKGGTVTRGQPKPTLDTPRPDSVPVPDGTFGTVAQTGTEPGLHLRVMDGHVVLSNEAGELDLSQGEDGFANDLRGFPLRVQNEQSLGRSDPFLRLDLRDDPSAWDAFDPGLGLECPIGG